MVVQDGRTFEVLTHNKLLGFADGNILRWFPRLNLLAISMNKMSIWVYRLNGERVYSINNKSPIKEISFLKNGDCFCLSGMDNLIKIYDSNSGKLIKTLQEKFDNINLISWSRDLQNSTINNTLFDTNVLKNIPKLTFNSNDISSCNIQDIDELHNETFNYLIVIDAKKFSINFNNLLTVTDIMLPQNYRFLEHFETSNFLNQYFLIENENNLELIKLKFKRFDEPGESNYLLSIILDLCKIISLINYLKEQISILPTEIKPFIDLLDRYLSNFKDSITHDEELKQHDFRDLILESLYDISLTNIIPANLKDYWLNQFGERGVKRLAKTGTSMYDLLRKNIFTKIISGIERLLIILNKFKGLSKWFMDSEKLNCFGLNYDSIGKVIEYFKQIMKRFYHLIWVINEEQKYFNIFINWVKIEIVEKLSKEDDIESYNNIPLVESFKISELMKYFDHHLLKSRLTEYFKIDSKDLEVLELDKPKEDIAILFDELNEIVDTEILGNVKEFIRSTVEFSTPISLNIGVSGNIKVSSSSLNETGTIFVIDNLSITLIHCTFCQLPLDIGTTKILLNKQQSIIEYSLNGDNDLLLLLSENNQYLLHKINLNSIKHGTIQYEQLKKAKELIISDLDNPAYICNNDSIGCVFDSSRKNYIVFTL